METADRVSPGRDREPAPHAERVPAWPVVVLSLSTLAALAVAATIATSDDLAISRWATWLAGIALTAALASWLSIRGTLETRGGDPAEAGLTFAHREWARRVAFAMPAIPFVLGILVVLEFVKDDAYISFRYAHNLVTGNGLVFNTGERLEGFTNFLWVLILAPFEALGWDLFQVCEVLGTALGIACLVVTARFTEWTTDDRPSPWFSWTWSAVWLSTSSSFVLWAKGGLEQPLASLLPIAGALLLWSARARLRRADADWERKAIERRYLFAGFIMGAGCMTRPELHLCAFLVGLPLIFDAFRGRTVSRATCLYVAGVLAVTVPSHMFRFAYYGTLVPNTFYVKTGTGTDIWRVGLGTVREMFEFNHTGYLAILAPLAFANRHRRVEKSSMALISLAFMAYYARVGIDEMQWHRLYLPALPFLCVLAAAGAKNGVDAFRRITSANGGLAYGVAWGFVALAGYLNFQFTYREQNGFNGHGDLAGTFHPDLGKFLVRHERPGALVAFQDMGSTPYHAPDLNFLDFFGLVDKTIAHARYDDGLHTFVGGGALQSKFDADMREYFFRRNPEWVILTIYTPGGQELRVARVFAGDPTGASFGDDYRDNGWQFGLWDDPRFQQRYVPVRTWPRSASYYLALWRRRDLWEQTPREIVLDALPADIHGVKASFDGGLDLVGSDVTPETPERHEAFVTTWWKLPGPMPSDVTFFVHFVGQGVQVPGDHVPGDWMYPADRWKAGQVIEDRSLFQLPPMVITPGTYSVYIGAFRRSTGERLNVISGPADGQNRVLLGALKVTPLYPIVQPLIPPTRVEVMRKYPDRIIDAHRKAGT